MCHGDLRSFNKKYTLVNIFIKEYFYLLLTGERSLIEISIKKKEVIEFSLKYVSF